MADLPYDSSVPATPPSTAAASSNTVVTASTTPTPKEVSDYFKGRIETSKKTRSKLSSEWKRNVELRLGRGTLSYTDGVRIEDELRSEINPDWSLTKTKTANLYSQVPEVQITHENEQYAPAIPPFRKALNYELGEKRANVGVAMEEALNDVVNAAGVASIFVGYAARFETVKVPSQDVSQVPPDDVQALIQSGQIEMTDVQRMTDNKFYATRLSPTDLLWPDEFVGSNFDEGAWIGRSGRMSWAEAKTEFKLNDNDKEKVVGDGRRSPNEDLRSDEDHPDGKVEFKSVCYDDIYYWRHRVDPEEKSFKSIWRLVFVDGLDQPAIHEPWKGQQIDPQTHKYVGACKFPIRVLTLTYISDHPIPPSDSSAGRSQVKDMQRSRAQMFMNRKFSVPIRWFDVNRIGLETQNTLMRGTWQGMVPTNGDGSRSIGEIARASYPSEDLAFDRQVKTDLMESWQIGPNQLGTTQTGEKTKAEIVTTQANFATRIGQERARVASFFLSIAEVLAGLMVLYSDFPTLTEQEKTQMSQIWDQKHVLHDLVLKIRPDSAVMIDSNARIERLMAFLNMTAKSGLVNIAPVIMEIAELSGLDPSKVMKQANPAPPAEPAISYRFAGKEDLYNPVVMAILMKSGQAPTPEELKAAIALLKSAQMPDELLNQPSQPGAEGGAPQPSSAPPEDYTLPDRVAKRSRDIGGE